MQLLIDYFMYSEGNVKALIVGCTVSLVFFILFLLTFLFGHKKTAKSLNRNICSKCGKENEVGMSFCRYCGNKL